MAASSSSAMLSRLTLHLQTLCTWHIFIPAISLPFRFLSWPHLTPSPKDQLLTNRTVDQLNWQLSLFGSERRQVANPTAMAWAQRSFKHEFLGKMKSNPPTRWLLKISIDFYFSTDTNPVRAIWKVSSCFELLPVGNLIYTRKNRSSKPRRPQSQMQTSLVAVDPHCLFAHA